MKKLIYKTWFLFEIDVTIENNHKSKLVIMLWAFVWIGNLQKLIFFLEIFAPFWLLEIWVLPPQLLILYYIIYLRKRGWCKHLFPWNFTRFSTSTEPVSSAWFVCSRVSVIKLLNTSNLQLKCLFSNTNWNFQ